MLTPHQREDTQITTRRISTPKMKKAISFVLLLLGMLFGSSDLYAQTSYAELKVLEARAERLAETALPDFAPELFKSVQTKVRELRGVFEKEGHVPPRLLREAQESLEKFQTLARQTQKSMGKSYGLRNAAMQFNFARAVNPDGMYRAEQSYREALKLAGEQKFKEARQRARQAEGQYKSLIVNARAQSKRQMTVALNRYKKAISSDLRVLNDGDNDLDVLGGVENVSERIRIEGSGRPTLGLNGNGDVEPPYWSPPLPRPGPAVSAGVSIIKRTANSIQIAWGDRSDNETGNRVLRSTDLSNWQIVREFGPIPKLTVFNFTDENLLPDTRYCYTVESFNAEGARRAQFRCTYTRDGNDIAVWRLQLRVKVANFAEAGSNNPLRISVGNNGEHLAAETFLDYGHDDFERNSDFTYDLNLDHIKELSDITDLGIANWVVGDDVIFIEEITLLANNHPIFSRHFGTTSASALRLSELYRVEHADLRSNPFWQSFVATSKGNSSFNLPSIRSADNGKSQLIIPSEEIVSRIESLLGHVMHADREVNSRFRWGRLEGPAVEVTQSGEAALNIDLDLEAMINDWPDSAVDIDFDAAMATRCDPTNERKLTVDLTLKNFTSNIDFKLWQDLVSLGWLKLIDVLVDWFAHKATSSLEIEKSFEVSLPENIKCGDLEIKVDPDANVTICCFTPP